MRTSSARLGACYEHDETLAPGSLLTSLVARGSWPVSLVAVAAQP